MTQNHIKTLISGDFGNLSDFRVDPRFLFFLTTDRKSRSAINNFLYPVAEKNAHRVKFDGSVGKPETRLFFFYAS